MAQTFFFYDLETSGLSARDDRIMQFAGIRTDMDLQPMGEPLNMLVRLSDDTLPSPDALTVTKISPQLTVDEGYSEAEFCKILMDEVFTPDTCTVGFNNVRFDDEFIRHILWRNFYDPYEWAWKDGRSRWDLLDVVRMTRALRPEGIEWPVGADGKATNRLELLTKLNNISHEKAHDALSDVEALIAITKLIQDTQPQLYAYLLKIRDKKAVMQLVSVDDKKPFVYVSGRYEAEYDKATVAFPVASGKNGTVIVYDLRYDPTPFVGMSVDELQSKLFASWKERQVEGFIRVPVKTLQYNRCPAVAPMGVLEQSDGWQKLQLNLETIERHTKVLLSHPGFADNLQRVYDDAPAFTKSPDVESQLYDGFVGDRDRVRIEGVRSSDEQALSDFHPKFDDPRLPKLLLHYKARSFPRTLSDEEKAEWESWRIERIKRQLPSFMKRLQELSVNDSADDFVLQELQLWLESTMPSDDSSQEV